MTDQNLVTIGICCYREGDWLRECWESVLAQDDDRWEAVMILDGGADEKTASVFNAIGHPRLRKVACTENLRHGGTRNKAFELTQTPYHFYVDADDLLVPQSVRWVLEGFERSPRAALVYGDVEFFGDIREVKHYPQEITWDVLARMDAFQGSGAAYRMETWRALGGLAREMWPSGSDFDFNIGLAEKGYTFFHTGKVLYRYRRYAASNSEQHAYRCWEKHETVVRRHPVFFADEARRQAFLTRGYTYSFRSLYEANDLPRARDVARKALAQDMAGHEAGLMRWLVGLPLPLFKALVPFWRLRHRMKRINVG